MNAEAHSKFISESEGPRLLLEVVMMDSELDQYFTRGEKKSKAGKIQKIGSFKSSNTQFEKPDCFQRVYSTVNAN
jgi:hypothetical protein